MHNYLFVFGDAKIVIFPESKRKYPLLFKFRCFLFCFFKIFTPHCLLLLHLLFELKIYITTCEVRFASKITGSSDFFVNPIIPSIVKKKLLRNSGSAVPYSPLWVEGGRSVAVGF